jgi:hypothetical protein
VIIDNVKIILASMYLDISQQIDIDLMKIEAIIQYAKGAGILIAMDSNSRSTSWHDTLTNTRGRILEEFLMSRKLHIMNEVSDYTTFQSCRGTIDLNVIRNQLLRPAVEWKISDQETYSDHCIIRYAIGHGKGNRFEFDFQDVRYIVQKGNIEKFQVNLLRLAEKKICKINKEGGTEDLDRTLCTQAFEENYIKKLTEEFHEVLKIACSKSFRTHWASKRATSNKSVPWWTEEITIMRKRLNVLRRR